MPSSQQGYICSLYNHYSFTYIFNTNIHKLAFEITKLLVGMRFQWGSGEDGMYSIHCWRILMILPIAVMGRVKENGWFLEKELTSVVPCKTCSTVFVFGWPFPGNFLTYSNYILQILRFWYQIFTATTTEVYISTYKEGSKKNGEKLHIFIAYLFLVAE